jgi:hypothetical protein
VANRGTGRLEEDEYPRRSRIHLRNLGSNRSISWNEGPRMPTLLRIDAHHIVSPGFVEELRSLLLPLTLAWTPARSLQPPSRRGRPRARRSARVTRGGGSGAVPTTMRRDSPATIRGGSGFRRGAAAPWRASPRSKTARHTRGRQRRRLADNGGQHNSKAGKDTNRAVRSIKSVPEVEGN